MMIRFAILAFLATLVAACGAADSTDDAGFASSPPSTDEPAATSTFTDKPGPNPTVEPSPPASTSPAGDGLNGTRWIVTKIASSTVADAFDATLRFVNGNGIGGEVACDGLYAEYRTGESSISLTSRIQRTDFGCGEDVDLDGEGDAVYDALTSMSRFTINGDTLELIGKDGQSLLSLERFKFPPLDPALNGDWNVVELYGEPPTADTRLTLTINEQAMGGFGGCNSFGSARSPLSDHPLKAASIAMTAVGCPAPPGLQEQEEQYVDAVRAATSYEVSENTLTLLDGAGQTTVRFERVVVPEMNSDALVATSWSLIEINDEPVPDDAGMTLILADERTLSGFAGCRDFSGTYEADDDGISIQLLDLSGTVCDLDDQYLRLEQAYVESLSDTHRYDVDGDRLQFTTFRNETLTFASIDN